MAPRAVLQHLQRVTGKCHGVKNNMMLSANQVVNYLHTTTATDTTGTTFSRFINQAIIQTEQIFAARSTCSCCVPCWNINLI